MTNEELFALKGVCDALGVEDRWFYLPQGEGDQLLLHPEKAPNARGAQLAGFTLAPAEGESEGEWGALLHFALREGDGLPDDVAARCGKRVVFSLTGRDADVDLPLTTWIEKDGTVISAGDRLQRFTRGIVYEPTLLTERVVLDRLHAALDPSFEGADTVAQAFRRLAESHPALAGLDWKAVGRTGIRLELQEATA